MMPRRGLLLASLVALAALAAGCADNSPAAGTKAGYKDEGTSMFTQTYELEANLTPPITTFTVVDHTFVAFRGSQTGNASSSFTYTWGNTNGCGKFTPANVSAVWYHGDDTDCSHASPVHPGTISVIVGGLSASAASTGYMTCEYTQGSATGQGKPCFVSSVAPAGQPAARHTSIPGAPVALALLAVGALALLRGRGRS